MTALGDRHSGDLGGQLVRGEAVHVAVHLPDAPSVADQHAAWLLINLLMRLEGVVDAVVLVAPAFPLAARVSPHAEAGQPFGDEALRFAIGVGGAPVALSDASDGADIALHVGAGPAVTAGWRVTGHGWRGRLSRHEVLEPTTHSSLPFGPYAAACLAAAEVFRAVRLPADRYVPVEDLHVDLWSCGIAPEREAPRDVSGITVDFGLAGVGAVGVAALQVLWPCEGLSGDGVIADNDPEGVDASNLNRYILFDRRHVGLAKASTAAAIYGAGQIAVEPIDGPYDLEHLAGRSPAVLLSAVDTNESRHDLQRSLAPGVAFGASTEGLRAELVVFGPPGEGPCLACHNRIIEGIPDDLRRAQVRAMSDQQVGDLAAAVGSSPESLREWAKTGNCGAVSAEALGHLLADDAPAPVWSVGFVSILAGVMLAAQLIKRSLGHQLPSEATSTKFQFKNPEAVGNGRPRPLRPDAVCRVCTNEVHRMVWSAHRS